MRPVVYRRTRCRCRHCRGVQTLRRHPDQYIRPSRCRTCARRDWRPEAKAIQQTHVCYAYPFPHRLGSCDRVEQRYEMRYGGRS